LACRPESIADCLVDGTDDYPAVCVGDDGKYFCLGSEGITFITAEMALAAWEDAEDGRLPDDSPAVMGLFNAVKYGA
jgi:hypothetical protein